MAFESPDLGDIAFLSAKGFPATPTMRKGNVVFFSVDIDDREAERLLRSAERELVRKFHQAFRRLRREIDVFEATQGRRP